jgi:2'-5' RNA ligase
VVRLFVALSPPGEVVAELWARTAALHELAPQMRWTHPEQWHLTLAFLGEVDDGRLAELSSRLGRVAGRHPALSLSFGGGGRFGQRVLWTGVRGDRVGLGKLADSARAAARRSGLAVEQRRYRPHLTLARTDRAVDLRPLVQRLESYAGEPWTATLLYLVRSQLGAGPDGTARHEPITSWLLGG